MSCNDCINVEIKTPDICVQTYPAGPRGIGIKSIEQEDNKIIMTFDNGQVNVIEIPDWWFGTRNEYNALSEAEKTSKSLYFIEEGT